MNGRKARVVCLCGSSRFKSVFEKENRRLTLEGYIVLSAGVFPHSGEAVDDDTKRMLDELHLQKIALSDEVRVLDVGGYIGDSTSREIHYARELGIPVSLYEPSSAEEAV